jgi:hypothetical protein
VLDVGEAIASKIKKARTRTLGPLPIRKSEFGNRSSITYTTMVFYISVTLDQFETSLT